MRNQVKSSVTAKNSNRSAQRINLNDILVGTGIVGFIMMPAFVETMAHPFVYLAAMAALVYAGKGFDFQQTSNR